MQNFFPKTSIKYSSAIGGDGHGRQLIKNLTVAGDGTNIRRENSPFVTFYTARDCR